MRPELAAAWLRLERCQNSRFEIRNSKFEIRNSNFTASIPSSSSSSDANSSPRSGGSLATPAVAVSADEGRLSGLDRINWRPYWRLPSARTICARLDSASRIFRAPMTAARNLSSALAAATVTNRLLIIVISIAAPNSLLAAARPSYSPARAAPKMDRSIICGRAR